MNDSGFVFLIMLGILLSAPVLTFSMSLDTLCELSFQCLDPDTHPTGRFDEIFELVLVMKTAPGYPQGQYKPVLYGIFMGQPPLIPSDAIAQSAVHHEPGQIVVHVEGIEDLPHLPIPLTINPPEQPFSDVGFAVDLVVLHHGKTGPENIRTEFVQLREQGPKVILVTPEPVDEKFRPQIDAENLAADLSFTGVAHQSKNVQKPLKRIKTPLFQHPLCLTQ
jgi:hypothetical protein